MNKQKWRGVERREERINEQRKKGRKAKMSLDEKGKSEEESNREEEKKLEVVW